MFRKYVHRVLYLSVYETELSCWERSLSNFTGLLVSLLGEMDGIKKKQSKLSDQPFTDEAKNKLFNQKKEAVNRFEGDIETLFSLMEDC